MRRECTVRTVQITFIGRTLQIHVPVQVDLVITSDYNICKFEFHH